MVYITGNAVDKYVPEQGREKKDIIYVISPFKNVAYQLSQKLKK